MPVSADIDAQVRRLWNAGLDSLAIADALRWHWPNLSTKQIEPIVCRMLNQAREERRKGRVA